jgi:hypothetical protein
MPRAAIAARRTTALSVLPGRQVSYYDSLVLEVHRSARKHGLHDADLLHAATRFLVAYPLTDEDKGPQRELRLGPDLAGNLLEIVVLLLDDDRELIIHGMRMRPKYRDLLH